ncbi:MAG TPA: MBL fold metallo-hydrolase [Saprospiraceae bacterium]|nr:MBL fold metallo-hydrolase [Saprospiraceae bacterium]HMP25520.1 MBL fold metallo-hydrolase [Saprospiraceae bacterium]
MMPIQFANASVQVFESALYRTTTTVLQTPDLVLVVDPNWLPEEVYTIRRYVTQIRGERPLYLLFTHADYDHIVGYRAFPEATVIASEYLATRPDRQALLQQVRDWDERRYIIRDYPLAYPEVDIVAQHDGQVLQIGGTRLAFWLAPGHTPDGLFTIVSWAGANIWLPGDYLSNIEFPFITHSSKAYEATLHKIKAALPGWSAQSLLVPGHGDVTTAAEEVLQRIQEAANYIQQLRATVQSGQPFDIEALWQRYAFRKGMEAEHTRNLDLMRREYAAAQAS